MAKKTGGEGYERFRSDLKAGSFQRMYVFSGEEKYLLEYYRQQLKKKLVSGPAEDFNYHRFTEENWDVEALSEAVEAIPMMSESSLVEVVDVDPFGRPDSERQRLTEIFSNLPEYCVLLYVYDTVAWKPDKRMKKLWGAMEQAALEVDFPKQSERQLIPWILRHLATGKRTMSDELCRYLILITGGSMTTLAAELQKLLSYSDQPAITRNDIDAVVIPVVDAAIFEITRAIGRQDFDGAMQKLRALLRQDVEPIVINAALGQQLRRISAAKILSEHGKGPYDLVKLCGVWESAAREIYGQAGGFKKPMLKQAITLTAETDYAMKTSGGDSSELLEMMVLRLAEMSGRTR